MTHPLRPFGIQAARVLECIRTLRRDYEPVIQKSAPEIGAMLGEAAAALDRAVACTLPNLQTQTGALSA